MENFLKEEGYALDPSTDVWSRSDYEGIAYSDGDEIENRIAFIVEQAKDRSLHSIELSQQCTDWASSYHLSKIRANILRPFEAELKGKSVLEIGAGCGAISRYLGESGATVLALEGTPRRAAIARARTRDLDNVIVLTEKFSSFPSTQQFDFITLIGVLEYANLFTEGENPAVTMLKQVCSLLHPDGKIIIAIENQLGLKYFAGAPEDHLGKAMLGIEGRYQKNQPETFGRATLQALLAEAGFAEQNFLAPFPDYKFPVSIVTEQGMNEKEFDASVFAWQSVKRDPQLPATCHFSLELAWQEVFKNKLALSLANSFLIVASPARQELMAPSLLAYHYSTNRIGEYCKETLFYKSRNNRIGLSHRSLNSGQQPESEPLLIKHSFPEQEEYIFGTLLSLELRKTVLTDGWTIQDTAGFLKKYLGILDSLFPLAKNEEGVFLPYQILPGDFFDLIPQNIILRKEDRSPVCFDKEWTLIEPLELGHLLFRALLLTLNDITLFGSCYDPIFTHHQLIDHSLQKIGMQLTEEDYNRYIKMEGEVQTAISKKLKEYKNKDSLLPFIKTITSLNQAAPRNTKEKRGGGSFLTAEIFSFFINNQSTNKLSLRYSFNTLLNIKEIFKKDYLIATLVESGLFDQEWYLKQNPDVAGWGVSPLLHYINSGEAEGRNPNPLFNVRWYLEHYQDVKETAVSPLYHYINFGWKEGRWPNPLFNVPWYLKENPDVASAGYEPLYHYQRFGCKEGRAPNPFSTHLDFPFCGGPNL